ncbi:ATP-binding protein [Caldalkalibacillus salinus]|uniref:ATP-binding protein n=1 Tax=Caldalkalibacillus salinus TaxID=2803787 RepID=UPI001921221F|nr:MoxR family ATPase [Caldalkalibacillus salinus]
MQQQTSLPQAIIDKIGAIKTKQREELTPEDRALIGSSGYTPPSQALFDDAVISVALGKNVLIQGPTGAGKTKLAESLSALFEKPMHMINCSVDLDAEAMIGYKTLVHDNGQPEITFVPGPVIKAMTQGHLLYIDEINMAKPETLPILNGILDYRRRITNPFTGDVVQAKEGFGVIAAINVGYVGTVPLNEALKNRFVIVDVPYLQGDKLKDLLQEHSALEDDSLLSLFVQLSEDLIFQTKSGQLSEDAASIRALLDAADLAVYLPPERAIQRAISDKLEDERERAIVTNIVDTLFTRS